MIAGEVAPAPEWSEASQVTPGTPPTILIVDDHPANLIAFEAILVPLGLGVMKATSGEEALRLLLQREFALVILDVRMPGMSGFDLAALLRSHSRLATLPIIFVTAVNRDAAHIFAGYAHGAVDYLLKPVEPEILRAKVNVFVELYRKHQTIRAQAELLHRHELRELERRNEERVRKMADEHRARLLEREQRAREEAESANRLKDEFLATVSHELRTPLNAILGWTRLIRSGSLDPTRAAQAMETIERNAQIQVGMVSDILDLSRIVMGKPLLRVGPLNLCTVVNDAVETVRPSAEARGVELGWQPSTMGATMVGDASRLQQVVWNLLSNAVKFTPKGGRVEIRLERKGDCTSIIVADNGAGIRSEFLPYVFDRFRQGDGTPTRTHDGLGLGLAIVKHVVELHGGRVSAESAGLGKGATFAVMLPSDAMSASGATGTRACTVTEAPVFRSPGRALRTPIEPRGLAGASVLFVEGQSDARQLVDALLSRHGAQVVAVETAQQALCALQASVPDVLISDIGLAGEDGYALMRRVRALEPSAGGTVPAIALTAYAHADEGRRAKDEGFQVHIAKPVEPGELLALVSSLVMRKNEPALIASGCAPEAVRAL
jgi:signal transduction histidine kinase